MKDTLKNWIQVARTSKWVFERVMQKFYDHPIFTSLVSHAETDRRGDSCSLFRALRPTVDFVRAMSRPDGKIVLFNKKDTCLKAPIKSFFEIFWRANWSQHVRRFKKHYNIPAVIPQFIFETCMKKYLPGGSVSVCREEYGKQKNGEDLEECLHAVTYAIQGGPIDETRILKAIEYNGENFSQLPVSLRGKREYILAVIGTNKDIHNLLRGKESWKSDRNFVLRVVEKNGLRIEFFSQFHSDKEIVLVAVQNNGYALEYAHRDLRKDPEIVLAAVRRNGYALKYAHECLKKDPAIVFAAVRQDIDAFMFADQTLREDRALVLAAVQRNGAVLAFVSNELKRDPVLVHAAVVQCGLALQYAHPYLRKDLTIVLAAVRQNGLALQYADASLKMDQKVASEAVQEDWRAFEYVHDDLKKDQTIIKLVDNRCIGTRVWE